jgi:hypothetical protein
LISDRTPRSSRAIRWFASLSNPASASTVRTAARRQASNSSPSKLGASEPMPVFARAERMTCDRVSTPNDSLGVVRAARLRLASAVRRCGSARWRRRRS